MFCPNCGKEIDGNIKFCSACGAKIAEDNGTPSNAGEQHMTPPGSLYRGKSRPAPSAVIGTAKSALSSPAALLAAIAYTAFVFFNIANVISTAIRGALPSELITFLYSNGLYYDIKAISVLYNGFSILQMIPYILMAIGLWMIYTNASNKTSPNMSTSGLTVVKVLMFIKLALISLGAFIGIIFALIGIFAAAAVASVSEPSLGVHTGNTYAYIDPSEAASFAALGLVAIIFGILIVIAVMAIVVIFYVKSIKTLNVMTSAARYGTISGEVSSYVGVLLYIMGICSILSGLSSFAKSIFNGYIGIYSFTSLLPVLCLSVAYIALAMTVFSYKNKMSQLERGI